MNEYFLLLSAHATAGIAILPDRSTINKTPATTATTTNSVDDRKLVDTVRSVSMAVVTGNNGVILVTVLETVAREQATSIYVCIHSTCTTHYQHKYVHHFS